MRFVSRLLSILLLPLAAAACTGAQTAAETGSPAVSRAATVAATSVNLPLLVGRSIDQVRRTLGPPRETKAQAIGLEPTAEQMRTTKGQDWINTFEKNGTTVVATFDARTRQVNNLVVLGDDEDELLGRASLSLTDTAYTVQPIANPKNNRELIGLRVVKK